MLVTLDWSSGEREEGQEQLQAALKENLRPTQGLMLPGNALISIDRLVEI
jgi:hypothetical protein